MYEIFKRAVIISLCLIILSFAPCPVISDDLNYADIILLNGSVYTVKYGTDWQNTPKEAIALKGGKILAVNTTSIVSQYIGPETRVYNLSGKMVLPGFIDSHIHLGATALLNAGVDLSSCRSIADIQRSLKDYAAENQDLDVIRGFGWNYYLFSESGPGKAIIDEIIPDKPVILISFDGHSTWVNSKALNLAGIDANTPDPRGGKIEHDTHGNPSGTLREFAAANLVTNKVPPLSSEQIKAMLEKILPNVTSLGITTADDAIVTPEIILAFSDLEREGKLPVRVFGEIFIPPDLNEDQILSMVEQSNFYPLTLNETENGKWFNDDFPGALKEDPFNNVSIETISGFFDKAGLFRLQTAKFFLDGVIEGHTGYLLKPYTDQPSTNGTINWNSTDFNEAIEILDLEEFQIDIHAIGDGAVRMSLDAYENAIEKNGIRDSRHKISHIQLIDPEDISRFKSLGVIATLQPNWFYYDQNFKNITLPYLGKERSEQMYTLRSILESGGVVAFGSDWPVGTDYLTFNPLDGIRTAVTRLPLPPNSKVTEPYRPEELINLKTAIEAATYTGAYTDFMENITGSLEEGKLADVIVIDKDLFTLPLEDINTAHVVATYLEGKEVYSDKNFSTNLNLR